jgi:very-short-patch-repair endonuclease
MVQPTRRERHPAVRKKKVKKTTPRGKRPHPKYGTSKLEDRFATEFLDRLGLKYVRQYEAKDIKRFYDFAVRRPNGTFVLIEIDGDYYHGHGLVHEEKSPMQKHNEWVDKVKNDWAHEHRIPLIRIWEHDINDNPSWVLKMLRERIGEEEAKQDERNEKKKRH